MDRVNKDTLISNRTQLIQCMDVSGPLMDILLGDGVLTADMMERFNVSTERE